MAFEVDPILDDRDVREYLKLVNKRFGDLGSGNKVVADLIFSRVDRDVMDHFRNERGPDGMWTSWSDSYADHMSRIGKSGNLLLQDSGRLRESFQVAPTQPRDGFLFSNPAKTSGNFPYAEAHDKGGEKLPKRKFMWVSQEALEDIGSIVLKWISAEKAKP